MKQQILLLCLLCLVAPLFAQIDGKPVQTSRKIAGETYLFDDPNLGLRAMTALHDEIDKLTRAGKKADKQMKELQWRLELADSLRMLAVDSIAALQSKRNEDRINREGLEKLIATQQAKLDKWAKDYQNLDGRYQSLVVAYAHLKDSLENAIADRDRVIADRDKTISEWGVESFREGFSIVLMKEKNGVMRAINPSNFYKADIDKVDEIQIPYKFKFNDSPTLPIIDSVDVRIASLDYLKKFKVYPKKVGDKWVCEGTFHIRTGNHGLNLGGKAATRKIEFSIFDGAARVSTTRKMILTN